MMPAKRIFMTWRTCRLHLRRALRRVSPKPSAKAESFALLFNRLDQLVNGLRIIERLADREARAHAAIQQAPLQQLVVTTLRGDSPTVQHEDGVRIADGR